MLAELEGQYKNIPQESIQTQLNTNLLLTGETLYYKLYCFLENSKKLSGLSKYAYVELINRDRKVVIKINTKKTVIWIFELLAW